MENIQQSAEAYALSYKRAMELSLNPNITLTECANAIASHYKEGYVNFAFGHTTVLNDSAQGIDAKTIVAKHLERFDKSGLGWKIRLVKHRIEVYCATSAQCWLTWEIQPKNGTSGWQWTNIYGFRMSLTQDGPAVGIWEYCVSDQEIESVMARCPNFMELA